MSVQESVGQSARYRPDGGYHVVRGSPHSRLQLGLSLVRLGPLSRFQCRLPSLVMSLF